MKVFLDTFYEGRKSIWFRTLTRVTKEMGFSCLSSVMLLNDLTQFDVCPTYFLDSCTIFHMPILKIATKKQETNHVVSFHLGVMIKFRVTKISDRVTMEKIRNYHKEASCCNLVS